MQKKMKNNGVTLVALVITIIVLLILAGVTISLILGEHGIFNIASKASKNYLISQEDEKNVLSNYEQSINKIINNQINNGENEIVNNPVAYMGITKMLGTNYNLQQLFPNNSIGTITYNGNIVSNANELPTGEYTFVRNVANNTVEIYDSNTEFFVANGVIKDLTNNGYDLQLINGAGLKVDDEGEFYISFDGTNDYGQIAELPATIDWANGFTVEFTARWDAFNSWSRIMDFSNGTPSDNLVVANYQNTSNLITILGNGGGQQTHEFKTNILTAEEKAKFKVEYIKKENGKFDVKLYKNDENVFSLETTYTVRNIKRIYNYIGKSPWAENGYFKGRIYDLKIDQADGRNILKYDMNNNQEYQYAKLNIVGVGYANNIPNLASNTNQYKMKLINGANIQKDELNNYYINFDGTNDYGQIAELPATIDWANGFTVEFTAMWDEFNSWSRIMDFSNGAPSDNLVVANYQNTSNLITILGNGGGQQTHEFKANLLTVGEKAKFKVEYIKKENGKFDVKLYKNDENVFSMETAYTVRNIKRIYNYIGKSAWDSNPYFKGRIYSLKIDQADGTEIINYNINDWISNI